LQPPEQLAHHRAGMRAPARNPATGAECTCATPRGEHRERQRSPHPSANDERRLRPAGGGHGAARGSVVLRELRQYRAAADGVGDPLGGAPQPPDAEFYKTLAKALEEIAAGLEALSKEE